MRTINSNLYTHSDYRNFLRERYQAAEGKLSLAGIGRRVGMSKMAVKYLIDGRRHLADARVDTFARAFALVGAEAQYFRYLVRFGKARSDAERTRWLDSMLKIRGSALPERLLDADDLALLGHWSIPTIAEMSYLRGFVPSVEWIRRNLRFKATATRITQTLACLKAREHIVGRSAGAKLSVPDGIKSHIYQRFTAAMIEKAAAALESQGPDEREMFNLTVSVSEARFRAAKERIAAFRHELHALLANDEACERVVQVNMQMFTLASVPEGGVCEA